MRSADERQGGGRMEDDEAADGGVGLCDRVQVAVGKVRGVLRARHQIWHPV